MAFKETVRMMQRPYFLLGGGRRGSMAEAALETIFEDHCGPANLHRRFGHTGRRPLYSRDIRKDWRNEATVVEKIRFQGCGRRNWVKSLKILRFAQDDSVKRLLRRFAPRNDTKELEAHGF